MSAIIFVAPLIFWLGCGRSEEPEKAQSLRGVKEIAESQAVETVADQGKAPAANRTEHERRVQETGRAADASPQQTSDTTRQHSAGPTRPPEVTVSELPLGGKEAYYNGGDILGRASKELGATLYLSITGGKPAVSGKETDGYVGNVCLRVDEYKTFSSRRQSKIQKDILEAMKRSRPYLFDRNGNKAEPAVDDPSEMYDGGFVLHFMSFNVKLPVTLSLPWGTIEIVDPDSKIKR